MRQDAVKYLRDRAIDDVELSSSYTSIENKPYTYMTSELMNDYEQDRFIRKEKSRFTIDVRKPQFKWFIVWCFIALYGAFNLIYKLFTILFL